MNEHFERDCLEILATRAQRGQISRRSFAQLAAVFLGTTALGLRGTVAMAQSGELVFVNWGGDAGTAYDEAYGKAFLADAGITVGAIALILDEILRVRRSRRACQSGAGGGAGASAARAFVCARL